MRVHLGRVCRLLAVACLAVAVARAADGRFEIIDATTRLTDRGWLVDARVDMQLSDAAVEALQSGVTLNISFQYEVTRRIRFWPDEEVRTARQEFELQYLSLSQRYLVRNLDASSETSYATLFSALRSMGRVRDFVLLSDTLDTANEVYYIAMRAVLDRRQLPGPLQILAFWQGDFGLESDWYRWKPK
ncbi:MAG: DUF4390 domain-containing protein [Gammaproteobacteria bacterium]|nr:DUF4390 domain-containing protein [Gammaproteobacteria bacterium]